MPITTLPEEDQHALGRELVDLAVAMGPTWLLDAPILLPRPADFPDQWRPDLDGAELMLERLLICAGLGEMPFTIDAYENDEALLAGLTAAFFAGQSAAVRPRRAPPRRPGVAERGVGPRSGSRLPARAWPGGGRP